MVKKEPSAKPKSKLETRLSELISQKTQLEQRLNQLNQGLEQTKQQLIATIGAIQELEKLK